MPINTNGKLRVKGLTTGGVVNLTDFISVWDTNLGDGQPTIQLPLGGSNYNFTVNWGDGTTDNVQGMIVDELHVISGFYSHTYAEGGVKTITITGTIEGWSFAGGGDCEKITSITNVGPLKLGNEGGYFYGCSNLTTIGGIFDLTGTTNLVGMFNGCTSLTSVNGIGSWDVSSVTSMGSMFSDAIAFNQPLNSWDVSSVTSMYYMFAGATSFNGDIHGWDVSSVTDMTGMFSYATSFNQDISGWDVSAVSDMSDMFNGATAFNQDISGWDVSAVTAMNGFMAFKSTANYSYYDNLLNTWSLLTLQNIQDEVLNWDMGSIEYTSAGAAARASIISNYSWNIIDGGLAA